MSHSAVDEPPSKKRRFFVEEPVEAPSHSSSVYISDEFPVGSPPTSDHDTSESGNTFNGEAFAAIVGQHNLSKVDLQNLKDVSDNNLERAINIFLDGSWSKQDDGRQRQILAVQVKSPAKLSSLAISSNTSRDGSPLPNQRPSSHQARSSNMPDRRYVGAFGVTAWATRSGSGLIRHGEGIYIERQKSQPVTKIGRAGKQVPTARQRQDVIVRFTNAKKEEVGRLENEEAAWLSTLLDQRICALEGSCVFAPERIRTNDSIYLQLRCYLLRSAFSGRDYIKLGDSNRQTGIFEAKETQDERALRLRQVALVRLFEQINLQPSKLNTGTEKHKKQGLLRAAEIEEEKERQAKGGPTKVEDAATTSNQDEGEDGKELEQGQLDSLYRKAQSFDFDALEQDPADTFTMDLRRYQKQALHWMLGKEQEQEVKHKPVSMHPLWEEYAWPAKDVDGGDLPNIEDLAHFYVNPYSGELSLEFPVQEQNCLGGVLADEMGLGKTIEMLSLIHTQRPSRNLQHFTEASRSVLSLPRLSASSNKVESAPWTTLVVAPMSLLAQWQSEAEKASEAGTLKILMYYGADKVTNLQHLCCSSNAATAPDVIITSYGVVLSEFTQVAAAGGNRAMHGGLFSVDYFRVILDEAHTIKNRQSKTAKACYEIHATHRWVLTGTPIVNRLEDLFSLVHFLKVEPWSNFSFWKTFITVPFESGDFIRALDVVQTVLEPLVLRRTKDMKTPDGEALVPLPPKEIVIDPVELSKDERDVYDHIFTRAKRTFNANVAAGTVMKSYTTIFAQILRLRQSCCHPVLTRNQALVAEELDAHEAGDTANQLADDMDLQSLVDRFAAQDSDQDANVFGATVLKQIQCEEDAECPICSEEPMIHRAVTGCWHSACKQCLLDYIEHQRSQGEAPRCFNCREPINSRDVFEVIRHDFEPEAASIFKAGDTPATSRNSKISLRRVGSQQSAKIDALLGHLKRLRQDLPDVKSVVFSQFTSFLDLIEVSLTRDHIPFLRFDGSMAQKQRSAVLSDFAGRKRGTVLLLSLRAGGVGLNLTIAKRVYMMDPWWSFAVEAQAIDRVHRMGQEDEVKVVRFIVEGSIEQKMLRIQDRKKFIASSLGMMSEEDKRMQRIEDIKELLS